MKYNMKAIFQKLEMIQKQIQNQNKILKIDDVVKLTGWSKSHVYKLTASNRIPHYKPYGKTIYFNREEIESFILSNRINTIEEIEESVETLNTGKKRF